MHGPGYLSTRLSDVFLIFVVLTFASFQCSANMSADAPGPSKHMSIEEEARHANKSFWQLSQEMEEAEAARAASGGDRADDEQEDDAEATDGAASGGHEDDTTTDGGDHTDGGGGSNPTAPKQKKPRRDRTPQALANVTDVFTEVTPSGLLVEPKDLAKGYGM